MKDFLIAQLIMGLVAASGQVAFLPTIEPDALQAAHIYRYDGKYDELLYGGVPFAGTLRTATPEERERLLREQKVLYARSLSTGNVTKLFEFPQGRIRDYRPSPTGDAIAVSTSPLDTYSKITLRLLTDKAEEFEAIENVRRYAWSPDGGRLVYVTGEQAGPNDEIRSTGTWIYDVEMRRRTRIFGGGHYVAWARFDGNIYILQVLDPADRTQDRVWRYDTSTGGMEPTNHRGLYFSPTGAYYYPPLQRGRFEIYETATDTPLGILSPGALGNAHPMPIGWLPSRDDLLLFVTGSDMRTGRATEEIHSMVYAPRAGAVADLGVRAVVGFAGDRLVIREPGGTFRKRALREAAPNLGGRENRRPRDDVPPWGLSARRIASGTSLR